MSTGGAQLPWTSLVTHSLTSPVDKFSHQLVVSVPTYVSTFTHAGRKKKDLGTLQMLMKSAVAGILLLSGAFAADPVCFKHKCASLRADATNCSARNSNASPCPGEQQAPSRSSRSRSRSSRFASHNVAHHITPSSCWRATTMDCRPARRTSPSVRRRCQ